MRLSRAGDAFAVVGCVGIVGAAVALHVLWLLPNHDNAWYLIAARRMLAGGDYMVDFADPNPPLIMLLNMPPVLLARATGMAAYSCFSLYVGLLILVSLALAARPMAACLAEEGGFTGVALVACAAVLGLLPGYDFGQREHLFSTLFLPFLFWAAARAVNGPARLGVADVVVVVLGAAGSVIKPFYLLVPGVLFVFRLAGREGWRALGDPAVFVFAGVVGLYGGFVLLAYPSFPEAAALQGAVYAVWDRSWAAVLDSGRDAVAPLVLLAVLAMLAPVRARLRMALWHCVAGSAACLALALLQKRGWVYHWLPTMQLALFGLAALVSVLLARLRQSRATSAIAAGPAFGLLVAIGLASAMLMLRPYGELASTTRARYAADPLFTWLRETVPGRKVMLLTGGFLMGFPEMADVELGASAPGQVLLPGTVQLGMGGPAQRARAAALRPVVVAQLVGDLERFRPDVVAVDRRHAKQALPDDYDVLGFYADDARFRMVWSGYAPAGSVPGWDLYRRKAPAG